MDLGAYAQIDKLDQIAAENGISCPRLRGFRLMKDEIPIDYSNFLTSVQLSVLEDLCCTEWGTTDWYTSSIETRNKCRYHIKNFDWRFKEDAPGYKEPEIRWDRLRGKKKRVFTTRVKYEMKKRREQYAVCNKYVGRDDILYIHARIGGNNWPDYYKDVVDQSWFIEKVDDAFDSTYCDIYARIKPFTGEIADEG